MMTETLSNLSREERHFDPPAVFAAAANVKADAYAEADADRLAFWEKQADRVSWAQRWTSVLDWSGAPVSKWFVGGKLNVAYNCVDRHVESGHGDQVAYHWRVSRATPARSLTPSSRIRCAGRRMPWCRWVFRPVTAWLSTCR